MKEILEILAPVLGEELAKDVIAHRNSRGRVKLFDTYRAQKTLGLFLKSPDPRLAAWEYLNRAANSKDLTQEYVKACLHYDQETGVFTRRIYRGHTSLPGTVAGTVGSHGYLSACLAGRHVLLHRLAWFYVHGEWPENIDHVDRDRLNNRLANLRECSLQENNWNLPQMATNRSGVKGVTWDKSKRKWFASIRVNGKTKSLGRYHDINEAARAYADAVKQYRGHFLGEVA